jgi:uncharacterized protein (DUF1778 family)
MVTRSGIVALRVNPEERQLIEQLAAHEERSLSDTMRRIILKAAKERAPTDRRQDGTLAVSTGP